MNSAPATAIDPAWICGLLQAGDSFYPTGTYAHSFGLEGLIEDGIVRDRETLRAFILHSTVPALRHCDLPLAAHAWRALRETNWTAIGELSVLASALRTAREARDAADRIGRQRAELAASLHDHPLAREYLRRAAEGNWPGSPAISGAMEGVVLGAPVEAVLAGTYYGTVASLMSAAMKLLRLGQNASQAILTEAMSHAPAAISAALDVPRADIGWFNPWLDIAAARHELANARMFIS